MRSKNDGEGENKRKKDNRVEGKTKVHDITKVQ